MSALLLEAVTPTCHQVFAWCVLPNHYHVVLETTAIADVLGALGRFHGRTSFLWNGEEGVRGRKVWHNAVEREMRSQRHLWASMNYVHHNPVKHGYVEHWREWPWGSARAFLEKVGSAEATRIWIQYPVLEYGAG